ncbi:hypothetical protein [Hymenobacter sp. IS2118]|uniref:hypothetical protein n=1 Tax=Hymenobacter sp. IS2118 TaxID=1505605 RepID=UPI0012690C6B|nr:hypothetical protein [Hymenobacter sp. IS2118]
MDVFICETRGQNKPLYWLIERPTPKEGRALVNIYSCSSRIWAQNQTKDRMVSVCNPERGDKYWDFQWQEDVKFEYWLTIDVDGESNCYYIKSHYESYSIKYGDESLHKDYQRFETIESEFSLYSITLISHLPDLIKFAVMVAASQGVRVTLDGLDESYL